MCIKELLGQEKTFITHNGELCELEQPRNNIKTTRNVEFALLIVKSWNFCKRLQRMVTVWKRSEYGRNLEG